MTYTTSNTSNLADIMISIPIIIIIMLMLATLYRYHTDEGFRIWVSHRLEALRLDICNKEPDTTHVRIAPPHPTPPSQDVINNQENLVSPI